MSGLRAEGKGLSRLALACAVLALTAVAGADDWRPFDGSWSATGTRETVPTERGVAAIARLSGAVVLSGGSAGVAGFTAEVIGFDTGDGTATGRAVWTDSRGDRIFSTLRGGSLETGRRISGTFTGGTGRWSGVAGDYSMTWQYVVAEGETIQGRAVDLVGRVRTGAPPR
jgi:hypothetical protein